MDTSANKSASVSATKVLRALFEIDKNNRQAAWYNHLMMYLPHAIFTSGEPEIIFNPAGFTYYNLELPVTIPEESTTIKNYTIPELIDTFLISEGVGIAIEASNPKQAIDLSYGDVLGFYLYRTFAEPEDHPFKTDKPRAHTIREGTNLLISDVPAQILPPTTRTLFEALMQHFGIKEPRIKLIYLPETEQHELAFSIDKNQFTPDKMHELLQKLGWFLPRYYSYLACDLNTLSSTVEKH